MSSSPSGTAVITAKGKERLVLEREEFISRNCVRSQSFGSRSRSRASATTAPGSGFAAAVAALDHLSSAASSSRDSAVEETAVDPGIPFRGTGLKAFDIEIPRQLERRFEDLQSIYGPALYSKLLGKRGALGSRSKKIATASCDFSMKWKYLGETESTAQLYIVIQCEERAAKKARRFFAQSHVVEDLGADFRVKIIEGGLRRLMAKIEARVTATLSRQDTLCGRRLQLSDGVVTRLSTIGGIVMVTTEAGCSVFALTAGHSAHEMRELAAHEDVSEEDDSDESLSSDSDTDDAESTAGSESSLSFVTDVNTFLETQEKTGNDQFEVFIGPVCHDSFENSSADVNCDWALVALNSTNILPNLATPQTELSILESRLVSDFETAAVLTSRGLQVGQLAAKTSALFISPGKKPVHTMDLKASPGSRLISGDSGAWVINPKNGHVHGHLVAIDAFGEGYVVPMQQSLENIREQLRATEVWLPSVEDLEELSGPPRQAFVFGPEMLPSYPGDDQGADQQTAEQSTSKTEEQSWQGFSTAHSPVGRVKIGKQESNEKSKKFSTVKAEGGEEWRGFSPTASYFADKLAHEQGQSSNAKSSASYNQSFSVTTYISPAASSPASSRQKRWAPRAKKGCITCRARRVKCDEGKPKCTKCTSSGRECDGYGHGSAISRPVYSESNTIDGELSEALSYYETVIKPDISSASQRIWDSRFNGPHTDAKRQKLMILQHQISTASRPHGRILRSGEPEVRALWRRCYPYVLTLLTDVNGKIADSPLFDEAAKILDDIVTLYNFEQLGENENWKAHIQGYFSLVQRLHGVDAVLTISPPLIQSFPYILAQGIAANTTSPANAQLIYINDYTDEEVQAIFNVQTINSLPFPGYLFLAIHRITRLRVEAAAGALGADFQVIDILADMQKGLEITPQHEPSWIIHNIKQRLEGIFFQAVRLYAVLSISGSPASISTTDVGLSTRWSVTVSRSARALLRLLNRDFDVVEDHNILRWPLVVAGVASQRGSSADREFVSECLYRIWDKPIPNWGALQCRDKLSKFWESGKTGWEDCFDEPFACLG